MLLVPAHISGETTAASIRLPGSENVWIVAGEKYRLRNVDDPNVKVTPGRNHTLFLEDFATGSETKVLDWDRSIEIDVSRVDPSRFLINDFAGSDYSLLLVFWLDDHRRLHKMLIDQERIAALADKPEIAGAMHYYMTARWKSRNIIRVRIDWEGPDRYYKSVIDVDVTKETEHTGALPDDT